MLIIVIFCDPAALIGLVEKGIPCLIEFFVVYGAGGIAEVGFIAFLLVQDAFCYKRFQTDEIGISGEG